MFDLFSFFTGVIAVLPFTSSMGENGPIFRAKQPYFPKSFGVAKTAPYKGAKIWLHSQGRKWPLRKGLKWPLRKGLKWPLRKGPFQGQKFGPIFGAKMAPP